MELKRFTDDSFINAANGGYCYFSNALGELHCLGMYDITEKELPNELQTLYDKVTPFVTEPYLVRFEKEYGLAVEYSFEEFFGTLAFRKDHLSVEEKERRISALNPIINDLLRSSRLHGKDLKILVWEEMSNMTGTEGELRIALFIPYQTALECAAEISNAFYEICGRNGYSVRKRMEMGKQEEEEKKDSAFIVKVPAKYTRNTEVYIGEVEDRSGMEEDYHWKALEKPLLLGIFHGSSAADVKKRTAAELGLKEEILEVCGV